MIMRIGNTLTFGMPIHTNLLFDGYYQNYPSLSINYTAPTPPSGGTFISQMMMMGI